MSDYKTNQEIKIDNAKLDLGVEMEIKKSKAKGREIYRLKGYFGSGKKTRFYKEKHFTIESECKAVVIGLREQINNIEVINKEFIFDREI